MGIGDIGWTELLFLLVLGLILLGPRRLPEVANAIGRSLREFRRALNEVQDEFRRETQVPSIQQPLWNRKFDAASPSDPSESEDAGSTKTPKAEDAASAPRPPTSES